MRNLHGQKSHFQDFTFDLNSSRDLAFLYSDCRFAQRSGARNVTVSIPCFINFVFSVKISWKFLILWLLPQKIKKRIHYWWCYNVYNFVHFSHEDLHILLMCCRFIFFNICWNSLLISFLYVSLRPLSCTLLIKLFDCLDQNIQTNGQ